MTDAPELWWENVPHSTTVRARTAIGVYAVFYSPAGYVPLHNARPISDDRFASRQEAQDVALADYTTRLAAQLATTPRPWTGDTPARISFLIDASEALVKEIRRSLDPDSRLTGGEAMEIRQAVKRIAYYLGIDYEPMLTAARK